MDVLLAEVSSHVSSEAVITGLIAALGVLGTAIATMAGAVGWLFKLAWTSAKKESECAQKLASLAAQIKYLKSRIDDSSQHSTIPQES